MRGPVRLADDERSPLRELVRAAIDDPPPSGAARRALVSLGLTAGAAGASLSPAAHAGSSSAAGTGAGATAAAGAKPTILVAGKWIAGVALASGLAGATAVSLTHETPATTAARAGVVAPPAKHAPQPVAPAAPAPTVLVAPAAPVAPAPTTVPVAPAAPVASAPTTVPVTPAAAVPVASETQATSAPGVEDVPSITDRPFALSPPERASRAAKASSAGDPVSDEVTLLDSARRALASGAGARAVALLDEHDRRFPRSGLRPEAVVLRIEALVRAGRSPEAEALGRTVLAAGSPYAARIRSLTGL